jgi:L,D-peptidoglycan transpeptidase YkuD (ErfK/YbiS/YcfS/YnhG family)
MRKNGMGRVRKSGAMRAGLAAAACGVLVVALSACGGQGGGGASASGSGTKGTGGPGGQAGHSPPQTVDLKRIPDVGDRLQQLIPPASHQVVAVYGEGKNSADSTVVLYTKSGSTWDETRRWPAHNGTRGWTTDHHENDKRSPVGVFTLTDAGGVLDDPGALLPYDQSETYQAPYDWAESHWHDFDYVIAINYNRRVGTPPDDPHRPLGQSKGGEIWLHLDHDSGTSGCVTVSESAMEYLLRTLDPDQHPVVVMGDKADLNA